MSACSEMTGCRTALWLTVLCSQAALLSSLQCSYGGDKYSLEANRWAEWEAEITAAEAAYRPCQGGGPGECSDCHHSQIQADLENWADRGVSRAMVEAAAGRGRATRYQVLGGKLYRSKDCMFPFRCQGLEHFLHQLAPGLPDTEFVINTRDWPQVEGGESVPMFSFSKTARHGDILYPAWAFWEGGPAIQLYPRGLGRWDLHRESLARAANSTPWADKLDLAFFRGSRTSAERDPLVRLSRACPHTVDAAYTKNQAWKSPADTLGEEAAEEVSLEWHCRYKYLFNYRGVAASFRFKHLFLCKSLVFHVGSDWIEFFYPALKPWIHYIPVPAGSSETELYQLLEFTRDHPDMAERVAEAGERAVRKLLRQEDVLCYWRHLLTQYTKLLTFTPSPDPALQPLPRP